MFGAKNGYLYYTPDKRYDRLKNSLRSSHPSLADTWPEHRNWKISPKSIKTNLITIPLTNLWWFARCKGMGKTLENAPTLPDPSYLVERHLNPVRSQQNIDRNSPWRHHRRHFWQAAISPPLEQFNPPNFENTSFDLQHQPRFTQKCHHCGPFFRISLLVTDTLDREFRQFDHFDCLNFINSCLCHRPPATHALRLYISSLCNRFWLIVVCIFSKSIAFSFIILMILFCAISSSHKLQARWNWSKSSCRWGRSTITIKRRGERRIDGV